MAMLRSMTHMTKATHFIPANHPLVTSPLAVEVKKGQTGRKPHATPLTTPTRHRPQANMSSPTRHAYSASNVLSPLKSPNSQRREKTAAAVAKRYKLRRKELWLGAMKEKAVGDQPSVLWIDGRDKGNGIYVVIISKYINILKYVLQLVRLTLCNNSICIT